DHRQQCCHNGQVHFDLHQREHAKRNDDVVRQRHHGTSSQTPFKTHGNVNQNTDQGRNDRQTACFCQFVTHVWTHEFNSAHFNRFARAVFDGFQTLVTQHLTGHVVTWTQAHHHFTRRTKVLHRCITKTFGFKG